MTVKAKLTRSTTAEQLVGRRVRLTPPTPRYHGNQVDLDVTEYLNDIAASGQHILMGTSPRLHRRLEIGLPDGALIEFLDEVAGEASE